MVTKKGRERERKKRGEGTREREARRETERSYNLIALISFIMVVRVILSLVLTLKVSANRSSYLSHAGNIVNAEIMGSDVCAILWCIVGFSLQVSSQLFRVVKI